MLISFTSLERLADTSRQNHIRLASNTINLWGIELDGSQQCLERCTGWLDEIKRQRDEQPVDSD